MIIRTAVHRARQPLPEFLLQELHDAADALQRKALATQRANHGHFGHVVKRVQPSVAFTLRHYNPALVPPLELARGDAGEPDYLR